MSSRGHSAVAFACRGRGRPRLRRAGRSRAAAGHRRRSEPLRRRLEGQVLGREPSEEATGQRAPARRLRREAPLPGALPAARRERALGLVGEPDRRRHPQYRQRASTRSSSCPRAATRASTATGGLGGGSQRWESYFREELIPLDRAPLPDPPRAPLARDRRVVDGRLRDDVPRHPAPGLLRRRDPDVGLRLDPADHRPAGIRLVASADYDAIFGPVGGLLRDRPQPGGIAANLEQTRVDAYVGNGNASPRVPQGGLLSGPAEIELHFETDQMIGALRRAGVWTNYTVSDGTHDWPYWRANLRAAIKRGSSCRPATTARTGASPPSQGRAMPGACATASRLRRRGSSRSTAAAAGSW